MFIKDSQELQGMVDISRIVGTVLKSMCAYAKVGMSTKELDDYGASLLKEQGAISAPASAYGFPGCTCISVNEVVAHGIPSDKTILGEGDLINIDVSASLNGFFSDNGSSFVLGEDIHGHQALVDASRAILMGAVGMAKHGLPIAELGYFIEQKAKEKGFVVIRNLAGHGIGRQLHESPETILNFRDIYNRERFVKGSVVAIETFIASHSSLAVHTGNDHWTMVGNKGGYVCQHEHTMVITEGKPMVLTEMNGIW